MDNPMSLAASLEARPTLPKGPGERFRGYGVMGLPFASGHLLAFRRMVATSVGPAYTAIWHRDPYRRWTMYVDTAPDMACPRYFGAELDRVVEGPIELEWKDGFNLSLRAPESDLVWGIRLAEGGIARVLSALAGWIPSPVLRSRGVLEGMGLVAGGLLGLGRLALRGRAPNGQWYVAVPRLLWGVEASTAVLDCQEMGPLGPHPHQASLGDFWIPMKGVFAFGEAFFEPFDATRHARAEAGSDSARTLPT